tara:strand:+ start:3832 stop:4542 length:711 start_codon:yes stop_codon:yes gene_type:complete
LNICTIPITLDDGREIALAVRRSSRAKRVILNVNTNTGTVEIVLPKIATIDTGEKFALSQKHWISMQLARVRPPIPFAQGETFPLLGEKITIQLAEGYGILPILEKDRLFVSGSGVNINDKVLRWCKAKALREIEPRALDMSRKLSRTPNRIAIRDTKSRWGSCSSAGNLNFSWRIVMAPEWVFNYVIAHEVSHLRELNHSSKFWGFVKQLNPHTNPARKWLRANGKKLHQYGIVK